MRPIAGAASAATARTEAETENSQSGGVLRDAVGHEHVGPRQHDEEHHELALGLRIRKEITHSVTEVRNEYAALKRRSRNALNSWEPRRWAYAVALDALAREFAVAVQALPAERVLVERLAARGAGAVRQAVACAGKDQAGRGA